MCLIDVGLSCLTGKQDGCVLTPPVGWWWWLFLLLLFVFIVIMIMIVIMIDVVLCCMFVIWKRLKTPCVLWWCHSHPAILTAANLFNDFYPRSRRPIFVGNSDGHGRWIQTFDATEFATRMEELIFFLRFQLDAAYGPRHLWTMRELNYCKLGVASLAETFFGVLCFLGGLVRLYPAVLRELPWKWSIWCQKRSSLPRN